MNTDVSSEKSLVIVTRFYDSEKEQCRDAFLGLIKVTSCTAEDLFRAIVECLENYRIPLTNMIGLAADNASVMMGNINGVQARFKRVIPNLFVLGCVCHSFHLCSSAAAHQLPRSLEDLIRSIYNYFSHSSNRSAKLREFQVFVQLKPHKILHPSQTRWLSLQVSFFIFYSNFGGSSMRSWVKLAGESTVRISNIPHHIIYIALSPCFSMFLFPCSLTFLHLYRIVGCCRSRGWKLGSPDSFLHQRMFWG